MPSLPWSSCSSWMISTKGLNRSEFLGYRCYHGDNAGMSATVSELDSKVSAYRRTPYSSELPLQSPLVGPSSAVSFSLTEVPRPG